MKTEDHSLSFMFNLYLAKMKLNLPVDSIQYTETKRAFMGGVSTLLKTMFLDCALSDDDFEDAMNAIHKQCTEFWEEQK